ncbi:uncharacterized protein BCR38DRAFT_405019 [Pseudomassariella vexata]|uniref:Uncharacterized protein n=1 Tax=Pseudomassariella vexata TaxID=1141098 RepID=A0A1Y2EME9_9PEZI|nr:uncharacterized protein BCR38DRAFT_405019 [Pseudomassariella vexata]ORY72005.1 hypothetical protein BCR38DRAFT_405019 [Pseudomassariella vexata]
MAHEHDAQQETVGPADPLTEANAIGNSESALPVSAAAGDEEIDLEESEEKRTEREEVRRTQSHTTDISTVTRAATSAFDKNCETKKSWYKTPNPLRWGRIPPVPEKREESREYKAGFFSKLTFQWMAPLMNVRELEFV